MVGYQGGKRRIGAEVAALLNAYAQAYGLTHYLEPFFGCGGVTRHVRVKNMVVTDLNADLLQLWLELRAGTFRQPPSSRITDAAFREMKKNTDPTPNATRAFYGLLVSSPFRYMSNFSSHWHGVPRTTLVKKEVKALETEAQTWFRHVRVLPAQSYTRLRRRSGWLIYADPPYEKVRGYWDVGSKGFVNFDAQAFWKRADQWAREGNHVFISYATAPPVNPERWTLVWRKQFKVPNHSAVHVRQELLWFQGPTPLTLNKAVKSKRRHAKRNATTSGVERS